MRTDSMKAIQCRTDNYSLYEAVHSMAAVLDKRLRVDIAIVREILAKGVIEEAVWVPREEQLADCLMKRGASTVKLLQVIEKGKL